MPARPYWTGRLRLALVSIPVQIYPATQSKARISFHQVHKPSGKRIRYEKVVPGIGQVDSDDIVKGYEVEKGKYVLLTGEEVDDVKLEAKRTVDLVQFVDDCEIDPVYFDRPFYVLPDEDSDDAAEAYIVMREALRREKKVGIGQLVVRGQSSLVALKPSGDGLVLETLRYADEIRKASSFFSDIPDEKADSEMIDLASELIQRKASKFDPGKFKDSYQVALRELIDAKLEQRPPKEIEEPERGATVINLMDALKRSVRHQGKGGAESGSKNKGRGRKGGSRRSKPRRAGAKNKAA